MQKRKLSPAVLIVYTAALYAVWIAWEFWGRGAVDAISDNVAFTQLIKSGIVKNAVWTLPAILLIKRFGSDVYITLREMFFAKVNWLRYLPLFAFSAAYILAGAVLHHGGLTLSDDFGAEKIIIVLFVGITEETVFRAWLLNASLRLWGAPVSRHRQWLCLLLNAVMFLLIHFPVWIKSGVFVNNLTSLAFIEIIVLGVIFGLTFIRSRSIFVPLALHMFWDLLVFMFI